jgi:hypothetical protein
MRRTAASVGANLKFRISEAEFMKQVIEYAKLHCWLAVHFRSTRTLRADGSVRYQTPVQADGAGWPDLVLVREARGDREGRVVFAELKTDRGRVRPGQVEWIRCLQSAGAEAYLWRPGDWKFVERVLAAGRRP